MNGLVARLYRWLQADGVILAISLIILFAMFSAPPLKPKPQFRCFSDPSSSNPQCPACMADSVLAFAGNGEDTKTKTRIDDTRTILTAEISKINEQIQNQNELEDRWYEYKFAIVGAFLAAFLGFAVFKEHNPEEKIDKMLGSNATCLVLALASVLAVSIDIHTRQLNNVTNQAGSWLAYYAEPVLSHSQFHSQPGDFILWENFLRVHADSTTGSPKGGMQADMLYSYNLWPHLAILTWVIYAMYLGVLYGVAKGPQVKHPHLTRLGFYMVHATILFFAWSAHSAPETFEFDIFGYASSGVWPSLIYASLCVPLTVVNFWHCRKLLKQGENTRQIAEKRL